MGDATQEKEILERIRRIQDQRTELETIQRDLTTEETALIERLRGLRISPCRRHHQTTRPVHRNPTPHATPRPFVPGDRVRVRNPNPGQPLRGTITRIGTLIQVTAPSGARVNRAPHNLILEVPAPREPS